MKCGTAASHRRSSTTGLRDEGVGPLVQTGRMQPISRRNLLIGGAALAITACSDDSEGGTSTASPDTTEPTTNAPASTVTSTTTAPTTTEATVELSGDPFTLGVASGDPDASGVVLWTRLAPDPLNGGGMPADDVPVTWEISATEDFADIAASGSEVATAAYGHSVHAVVTLEPGRWFYRFVVGSYISPVGITQAAPANDVPVASVRFAAASCQDYSDGYYAAHRDIAEQAPDFVVWLGDYIYESGQSSTPTIADRTHLGIEPTTLPEYRDRYALYKADPQLQAAHAACPWFVIWDDHEVENNYATLTPQNLDDSAGFEARRFAAYQSWWEHQPVRLPPPSSPQEEYRIYRDAQWGDLVELALLDGRQYRNDQACGDAQLNLDPPCPETFEATRTMLGAEQEQWLLDTLAASTAAWNVVGNQVVLADATFNSAVLNYDQWDGYQPARQRLLQGIDELAIGNLVVVTGDIHLAAVAQLRNGAPGVGTPVGVEFVTTSISSTGSIDDELTEVLRSFPDLLDAELAHRGYTLHTVTPERWSAEYRIVTDVLDADSALTVYGTYTVESGSNTVVSS